MGNTTKKSAHFEDYLRGQNCSSETIHSYIRTVTQFLELLHKTTDDDIVEDDLGKFKVWVTKVKKYKINTLTPKYAAINKYVEYLKKPREWRETHKLIPPKKVTVNKNPLTRKEIEKIFSVSEKNPRDHALLKVLYYTLLRRGEVVKLNVDDIQFERQKVYKNNGKGHSYATLNIHPDALESIKVYLEFRTPKPLLTPSSDKTETKQQKISSREIEQQRRTDAQKALFLSKDGYRLKKTAIAYTVKKYAVRANISKRVYPHLFRISGITHMAERGLRVAEIMQQSTHKDPKVVMGYIQLSDKHVKDQYLKGLSLDSPKDDGASEERRQVVPKESIRTIQYHSVSNTDCSVIGLKLVERLANGEISNEMYHHAITQLKQHSRPEDLKGYL